MKRKIIAIILLFTLLLPIKAIANESQSDVVYLSNCANSESARFILGVNEIKVKFIGIQLEEKKNDNENDNVNETNVSNYVCELLKNAKEIKIEYEPNIEKEDRFGRIQAWVFVDDVLLQEDLINKGYAKAMYLEDNYTYTEKLKEAQKNAKENKIGIWEEKEEEIVEEKHVEEKKSKGIIDMIVDFFASIFRAIRDFIDSIISGF